jgi:prevent-host-death family protein
MTERISTLEVRQRLGDMLNRVALRHDEFVIERKGKALAALVSVAKLEQMRQIARRNAVDFLDQQKGGRLSDGKAAELALAAQVWARKAGKTRLPRK